MESRIIRMLDRPPAKPLVVAQKTYETVQEQPKVKESRPRPRKQTSRGILLGTKEVTRRQYEIILLSLQYKSIGDISEELNVRRTTVSMLKSRLIEKFGNWLTILQLASERERNLLGNEPEAVSYITPEELKSSAGYRLALVDTIRLASDPSVTKENLIKLLKKQLYVREGKSDEEPADLDDRSIQSLAQHSHGQA
jgi:DNA-binding CsgD family transcriptional regulator